jgi:hypothetical protein
VSADDRTVVHPVRLQAGKQAFADLVDAIGGQVAAEAYSGKAQSRISAYGGRNTPWFPPVDVVVKLEGITHGQPGHPHVTRWLAREAGFGLVCLPMPGAAPTQWSGFIARLGKDAGELISGICTDLTDDNDVIPAEARQRLGDAADLVRIAVELEAALKARAGEADAR